MPQVVACWCVELGHEVTLFLYTGVEDLYNDVPKDIDIVFISAFTQSAIQAYALGNMYRSEGVITVLEGPHARCYPEDAQKYFDYVLGLTDKDICRDVLEDLSRHEEQGRVYVRVQTAGYAPGRVGNMEIRLPGTRQGHVDKGSPDDRKRGLPLYVQLLYRRRPAVPDSRV